MSILPGAYPTSFSCAGECGMIVGPHSTKLPQSWDTGSDQPSVPAISISVCQISAMGPGQPKNHLAGRKITTWLSLNELHQNNLIPFARTKKEYFTQFLTPNHLISPVRFNWSVFCTYDAFRISNSIRYF